MKKKPSRKAKPSKLVKPLTKEQLVKLYEEFKEKRLKEHNEKLDRYYELGYADLRCTIMLENLHFWNWKKRLQGLAKRLDRERPTYHEPTFNEFMESLGEKKIMCHHATLGSASTFRMGRCIVCSKTIWEVDGLVNGY